MKEPEIQNFTYEEFIKYLDTDFKRFLSLQLRNKEYNKNMLSNRRLGYNKYLEMEEFLREEILIPKEKYKKIENVNSLENKYNIKIDCNSLDKNIMSLFVEGTVSNILDFKNYLREIIEEIPPELRNSDLSYIIISNNKLNRIIGKNGSNIASIQEITNTKIMIVPKDNLQKRIIVAGNLEQRRSAREMIYEILTLNKNDKGILSFIIPNNIFYKIDFKMIKKECKNKIFIVYNKNNVSVYLKGNREDVETIKNKLLEYLSGIVEREQYFIF